MKKPIKMTRLTCPWCDESINVEVQPPDSKLFQAGICNHCIQPIVIAHDHDSVVVRKPTREEQQILNVSSRHQDLIRQQLGERPQLNSLLQAWNEYRDHLDNMPEEGLMYCRRAFYGGALYVISVLMKGASSIEELKKAVEDVTDELQEFTLGELKNMGMPEHIIEQGKERMME